MIKLTRKQAIQWAHDAGLINKEDYAVEFMGALADDIQRFASVAYEAGQKDERESCARMLNQIEQQRDELLKIAKDVIGMLENCSVESGVCHCGDDMARHSSAMSCGHAPVDIGSTYADHLYEKARAAIASVKGGAE